MKNGALASLSVAILAVFGPGQGKAGTLLDLVNPPDQSDTPYSLTFVAGAATTDITFAGYQSPERLYAEDISLTSGGGNLLGTTWTFTPFDPLDTTDAGQFNDGFGSGTNGLFFANGTGRVDHFDQDVTTVAGQTYTLHFLFSNNPGGDGNNGPSELIVSASAVPEPASVIFVGFGLSVVGLLARKRLTR